MQRWWGIGLGFALSACSFTGDWSGFSSGGPAPESSDAGPALDGSQPIDRTPATDGGVAASCEAHKQARPSSPDGFYDVDPDGNGPAPVTRVYCDMTNDGGGWMLVTPDLASKETPVGVTVVRGVDEHGGLSVRVYANNWGCGHSEAPRHVLFIDAGAAWKSIRARYGFGGQASCWDVFGQQDPTKGLPDPNVLPFDAKVDMSRDAVGMGGTTGNAFDGVLERCDSDPANFWDPNGSATAPPRSIVLSLRRNFSALPAGLYTVASCTDYAPGTSSHTWWEYREIYVK